MKAKIYVLLINLLLIGSNYLSAQEKQISGVITEESGEPIIGASIVVKGTSIGTTTDLDGKFTLSADQNSTIVISFVGFETQELSVGSQTNFSIVLEESTAALQDIVVLGTRGVPRSEGDTPLPIDKVGSAQLLATGQTTFDKALQYTIPSFNTVQTPVNDATSLLDPYEIRNMGPSRTLILVNGKRKNLSSLLYVQTSPGRGETGADISAIPVDAIKRVEVLRDGASAQYGSDAIAGVVNIVLKDQVEDPAVTLRTGITSEGDGETYGLALTNGQDLNGKGFLNYTLDFSQVGLANRPGEVNAAGEIMDFTGGTAEDEAFVNEFLSRKSDAGNINGAPETTAAKFLINSGMDISDNTDFYANAAYVFKKVNSFANYRTPYWRTIQDFPYLGNLFPGSNPNTTGSYTDEYSGNTFDGNGYDGYVPTFEGTLWDYNGTIGIKGTIGDWNHDASLTIGGNQQTYRVNNSHNRNVVYSPSTWIDVNNNLAVDEDEISEGSQLYRENSPTSFFAGGTRFSHIVGNIDVSRAVSDKFSVGFGTEFRSETFVVIEGDVASYEGGGADSFAGNQPENSGTFNRFNIGGYLDLSYDFNDNFLVSGTVRGEEYSDFGEAFVWKLSSRYKLLGDNLIVRGSVSTGFRAPTLHQIYTQKAQYAFIPGQGIQVGGLINNVSPQATLLGIPELDAETSKNFTAGVAIKPSDKVSITMDYYNITVEDRIVLGTEIGATESGDTALDDLLAANSLSDVSFFSNAIDSRTSGLDFVASISYLSVGSGELGINLAGNVVLENKRINDVDNPAIVEQSGQSVVNATQEALIFTSRPETKWILGMNYAVGKFNVFLNNTYFGKTTFKQQGMDSNLRTEFDPKVVTDLGFSFRASESLTFTGNINNIFNILPEWKFVAENSDGQAIIDDTSTNEFGLTPLQVQSNLITFNQRYSQMTYDGSHFSQLGTLFNLAVQLKF